MSAPQKFRPSESELTKLKVLWRDSLSDDAKEFWRSLFLSADVTQANIRQQLFTRLKINLRYDSQLNAFRDWELDQRERELQAERMEENRTRIKREHPDWTKDDVLAEVLKCAGEEALSRGDYSLGLKTVREDLNVKRTELESRRIVLLEKKAAAYDRAQKALEDAKASKGGITEETFRKVESELKLL